MRLILVPVLACFPCTSLTEMNVFVVQVFGSSFSVSACYHSTLSCLFTLLCHGKTQEMKHMTETQLR